MIRKAGMMIFSLGFAGLGIQLAQSLAARQDGASSMWSSRVEALELGFVIGLLGIVLWSLARARLGEALDRTRLEDATCEFDAPEIPGGNCRLIQPEERLARDGVISENATRRWGRSRLVGATVSFDLGDEVAG
jgi:hypothetical protein